MKDNFQDQRAAKVAAALVIVLGASAPGGVLISPGAAEGYGQC